MVIDPADVEIKDLRKGGEKELKKIWVVDISNEEIDINLWGDHAHNVHLLKN